MVMKAHKKTSGVWLIVEVPVEVLPDYDPDYRPEAMERERMTEDFRRMGEVLSSVSGVEYAAPCRPYFPGGPVLGQRGEVCRSVPSVFPRH